MPPLAQHTAEVLEEGDRPASKQFDDDKRIRSLTEAQEVTTDVQEDSVTYDQQKAGPQKVRPIQMEEFLREDVSRRLLAPSDREIVALTTSMRQIGVGTPGGGEALGIFHQRIYDEWMTGSLSESLARIKVDEKLLRDDRVEGGARGGVVVSPKAHGSSCVETSKLVSRRARWARANAQGLGCRTRAAWLWVW